MKNIYIIILLLSFGQSEEIASQNLNFVWAKQLGGTARDYGHSVAVDAIGNVYTTGIFSGTADFDPSDETFNLTAGAFSDIFLSKLDNNGNFIWAKNIVGGSSGYNPIITVDASGNIYITGEFNGTADFDPSDATFNLTSAGSYDAFISKLDNSGNFIWAKNMGGESADFISSIVLDTSGNVYTTGEFQGTADFDPNEGVFNLTSAGSRDIFISKLDNNGNFIWAKSIGGLGNDFGFSLTLDATGNVYTTGGFQGTADFDPSDATFNLTSPGSLNIFISKLDNNGNFIWAKSMVGESGSDLGRSIAVDAIGNVFTIGYFQYSVDFDPGAGVFYMTTDGRLLSFISKLDNNGNFIWAKAIDNRGTSMALDVTGNIFITGAFSGTVDFDLGTGTFNLVAPLGGGIFISKLDNNGNFIWAKSMGGTNGTGSGNWIALSVAGNVYITGGFVDTVDFDPSDGTFILTSLGDDIFVEKLCQITTSTSINDQDNKYKIAMWPNPSKGLVFIKCEGLSTSSVKLIDNLGRLLFEDNSITPDGVVRIFHIDKFPPGIYHIEIAGKDFRRALAIIKN
ncbi:MAG: SBBP repeat-containing protein [Bacteroidia bacterium]|nr:SBBP repeat-containing protein [Bacteroidia bacterium]